MNNAVHLLISDLDLRGSGYMNIALATAIEMTDAGKNVTILGIGYDRSEHNYPFSIIPVNQHEWGRTLPGMMGNLFSLARGRQYYPIASVTVALDVPHQVLMHNYPREVNVPHIGIFPIESGPLMKPWADGLGSLDACLIISKYGTEQAKLAGLPAHHYPVGIDTAAWRMPEEDERVRVRTALGYDEDDFVVITVADNQERKNLSVAVQAIALAREKIPTIKWVLVTRIDTPFGWKLQDLTTRFGVDDIFMPYERGLAFDRLWSLVASADAFLLTSKAEGLCMPVIEAQAAGTPVIISDYTALPEHIFKRPGKRNPPWLERLGIFHEQPRGLLINVEFETLDVWGNSMRAFVSAKTAARHLIWLRQNQGKAKHRKMVEAARAYAESRTWRDAGRVVNRVIDEAVRKKNAEHVIPPEAGAPPPTVPQPVEKLE